MTVKSFMVQAPKRKQIMAVKSFLVQVPRGKHLNLTMIFLSSEYGKNTAFL
jgi:hypothetical protein